MQVQQGQGQRQGKEKKKERDRLPGLEQAAEESKQRGKSWLHLLPTGARTTVAGQEAGRFPSVDGEARCVAVEPLHNPSP